MCLPLSRRADHPSGNLPRRAALGHGRRDLTGAGPGRVTHRFRPKLRLAGPPSEKTEAGPHTRQSWIATGPVVMRHPKQEHACGDLRGSWHHAGNTSDTAGKAQLPQVAELYRSPKSRGERSTHYMWSLRRAATEGAVTVGTATLRSQVRGAGAACTRPSRSLSVSAHVLHRWAPVHRPQVGRRRLDRAQVWM
jgi:hypothetical protein